MCKETTKEDVEQGGVFAPAPTKPTRAKISCYINRYPGCEIVGGGWRNARSVHCKGNVKNARYRNKYSSDYRTTISKRKFSRNVYIGEVVPIINAETIPTNSIFDSNISAILINKGTRKISKKAFVGCAHIDKIFYQGTEQQWRKVSVNKNNEELLNAKVYFYSHNYPFRRFRTGNFWYYDKNGNIVIWTRR